MFGASRISRNSKFKLDNALSVFERQNKDNCVRLIRLFIASSDIS